MAIQLAFSLTMEKRERKRAREVAPAGEAPAMCKEAEGKGEAEGEAEGRAKGERGKAKAEGRGKRKGGAGTGRKAADLWGEEGEGEEGVRRPVRLNEAPSGIAAVEVCGPASSYRPAPEDIAEEKAAAAARGAGAGASLARRPAKRQRRGTVSHSAAPTTRKKDATKKRSAKNKAYGQNGKSGCLTEGRNEASLVEVKEESEGNDEITTLAPEVKIEKEEDCAEETVLPSRTTQTKAVPLQESETGSQHNPWSTKLSRTERNKMRKRKLAARQRWKLEAKKRREQRKEDISTLVAEIEEEETAHALELKQRELLRAEMAGRTKRLGKYRFREPATPVLAASDVPQNLRQAKEHVNLFRERFLSFQKRNMLAPQLPIKCVPFLLPAAVVLTRFQAAWTEEKAKGKDEDLCTPLRQVKRIISFFFSKWLARLGERGGGQVEAVRGGAAPLRHPPIRTLPARPCGRPRPRHRPQPQERPAPRPPLYLYFYFHPISTSASTSSSAFAHVDLASEEGLRACGSPSPPPPFPLLAFLLQPQPVPSTPTTPPFPLCSSFREHTPLQSFFLFS
jgi:hypothetical protein